MITNPPGQDAIGYRVADFAGFRAALLASLPDEQDLTSFAPAAGDLGLQILEWWEFTSATSSRSTTSGSPPRVTCGLRPGRTASITWSGSWATGRGPASPPPARSQYWPGQRARPGRWPVPAAMAVTSTASPGVPAQTFETTASASFSGPSDIPITLVPPGGMTAGSMLLAGTVTGIKTGDSLLLVPQGWDGTTDTWAVVTVQGSAPAADPSGGTNTMVSFVISAGIDPAELPGPPARPATVCSARSPRHR